MAVQNTVGGDVLRAFRSGAQLGAREVMDATGRGRVVYKYLNALLEDGTISVVRWEQTKRKPRAIFQLATKVPKPQF